MAVRRQGYLFEFKDIGNLPIIRIDALSSRQQSILVGLNIDDGFGVLTKSLYKPPAVSRPVNLREPIGDPVVSLTFF